MTVDYNTTRVVRNVFTPFECQAIIDLGLANQMDDGEIYHPDESGDFVQKVDRTIRDASNFVLPENGDTRFQWIRDRMAIACREVNDMHFQFSLSEKYPARMAIVKYPTGGRFGWHVDNLGVRQVDGTTLYKKLSCVVQLSDPRTYAGGNLEFMLVGSESTRERGAMNVFPTFMFHRVSKVTQGERFVLVCWAQSETPFR